MRKPYKWIVLAGIFLFLVGCSGFRSEKALPISATQAPPPEMIDMQIDELPKDYFFVQESDVGLFDESGKVIRNLFFQERVFLVRKGVQRSSVEDYAGNQGYVARATLSKAFTSRLSVFYDGVEYGLNPEKNKPYNKYLPVKAVYMPSSKIRDPELFMEDLEDSVINTVVIDYKNDYDQVLFSSPATLAALPDAPGPLIDNPQEYLEKFKKRGFHTIARIVVFRSNRYALKYPERSIADETGELYYSAESYWVSPYNREYWKYILDLSNEAFAYGFDEVQFDHMNFPISDGAELVLQNPHDENPPEAIQKFLTYIQTNLNKPDALIGANVFGWSAVVSSDIGIGQQWEAISAVSDIISPMFYPSLFSSGNLGISRPQRMPYETVKRATELAVSRNENVPTPSMIRPWLQAYDGVINFREKEIADQVRALKELGITEYMLWNPEGKYSLGGLDDL